MSTVPALGLALALLLGNAFFVAAEFALVSARRTQIEPLAEAGSRFARTTLKAMENISLVIGVNQLGITVCSLVLGAVGEPAIAHLIEPLLEGAQVSESLLHPLAFVISMAIVVYLHVVMGEMIPKNIALAGPDRAALVLGPAVWGFVKLMRPVIVVINAVAAGVLRLMGVELKDEVSSSYTREEVAALVEESRGEGLLRADEYDRLAGALGFTEKTVNAVLMPMESLTTLPLGSNPAAVEELCAATGYSRFPVLRRRRWTAGLPPHQGRPGDRARAAGPSHRPQVDPAVRQRPGQRRPPRRSRDASAQGCTHGTRDRRGLPTARPGHPRGRARGAGRGDPGRGAPGRRVAVCARQG